MSNKTFDVDGLYKWKDFIDDFRSHIKSIGFPIVVTVRSGHKMTDKQRKLWFTAIVTPVMNAMNEQGNNYSKDVTSNLIKLCIGFYVDVEMDGGEIQRVPRSFSKRGDAMKKEISDCVEKARAWALDFFDYNIFDRE